MHDTYFFNQDDDFDLVPTFTMHPSEMFDYSTIDPTLRPSTAALSVPDIMEVDSIVSAPDGGDHTTNLPIRPNVHNPAMTLLRVAGAHSATPTNSPTSTALPTVATSSRNHDGSFNNLLLAPTFTRSSAFVAGPSHPAGPSTPLFRDNHAYDDDDDFEVDDDFDADYVPSDASDVDSDVPREHSDTDSMARFASEVRGLNTGSGHSIGNHNRRPHIDNASDVRNHWQDDYADDGSDTDIDVPLSALGMSNAGRKARADLDAEFGYTPDPQPIIDQKKDEVLDLLDEENRLSSFLIELSCSLAIPARNAEPRLPVAALEREQFRRDAVQRNHSLWCKLMLALDTIKTVAPSVVPTGINIADYAMLDNTRIHRPDQRLREILAADYEFQIADKNARLSDVENKIRAYEEHVNLLQCRIADYERLTFTRLPPVFPPRALV